MYPMNIQPALTNAIDVLDAVRIYLQIAADAPGILAAVTEVESQLKQIVEAIDELK